MYLVYLWYIRSIIFGFSLVNSCVFLLYIWGIVGESCLFLVLTVDVEHVLLVYYW